MMGKIKIFIADKVNFLLTHSFFVNKLIIFEYDLENQVKFNPSPINLSFRFCQKKDIDSMDNDLYGYNEQGKNYSKNQFDKGDRCILAINDGRIVGYVWIMKDHLELSINNNIQISGKRSYIYKGFVLYEFRGKRILSSMDKYVFDLLKDEGKKFVVTTVSIYNTPSLQARERSGFRRVGEVIQIRFLGLQYDYISREGFNYLQSP